MDLKQTILDKVELAGLISQTLTLRKVAGRHVGLCPFHEEKTPSFTVYDDHFFCFGCKASGDAIEFVRKKNGVGFIDALHFLGEKYGVDTSSLKKERRSSQKKVALYRALLTAQDFFHTSLLADKGRQALSYLRERKVSTAEIQRYKIGYAPDSAFALKDHLRYKGVPTAVSSEVSLLSSAGKGDFFRHRIMFPIHEAKGRVIGFGGRALAAKSHIKYLNSRENPLFHKAKALFGLWHASAAIAAKKTAIIVEGYFDWLTLQRAGITHSVCCMGTALTAEQMKLLKRHVNEVVLLFDGDHAGIDASLQALKLVFAFPEIAIKICQLPQGHDPDSYVLEHGGDGLQKLVVEAEGVIEFAVTNKLTGLPLQNYPLVLREEIIPLLRKITDPIQRGSLIAKITEISGISLQNIEQSIRQPETEHKASSSAQPRISIRLQEFIGHLYYTHPREIDLVAVQTFIQTELDLTPDWERLFTCLLTNLQAGKRNCDTDLTTAGLASHIEETLAQIKKDQDAYQGLVHGEKIKILFSVLKQRKIREKIALLRKNLHQADADSERVILNTIMTLRQELGSRHEVGE